MRFRMHRGSLDESMKTVIDVDGFNGLAAHIREKFIDFGPTFDDSQLKIKAYGGDDARIGWRDVHIVTIDGYGVVSFCEGPIPN